MGLSVELVADVTVHDLLLVAVKVAVQGTAREVLDTVVNLLTVRRQLDENISEQLDQFLVPTIWRSGRAR